MFLGGPAAHVGADLGDQTQRVVRTDAIELRKVGTGELKQRGPDLEARRIAVRRLPGTRRRGRTGGRALCGHEVV